MYMGPLERVAFALVNRALRSARRGGALLSGVAVAARDRAEDHAFADAPIADHHARQTERLHQRRQDQRARRQEPRAARVHARHVEALLVRRAAQSLRELLELILGDEQAAQRAVLFLEQETTERARGAAGCDAAHRRERVDARHQRRERLLDAAAQAARFASAHRVGGRELAVQRSATQPECLFEAQLRGVADRELETAAAEVEAERGLFAQTDAAAKRREDQARLFLPRQDPHVRVQCAAELLGELAAVLRVAQRGGRDRQRLLRARALRPATQAARRVDP